MSDARSLLRQQRAARRIDHPHVQYSAGKAICTICHEPIKSEALWENHTRSPAHRQRLLTARAPLAAEAASKSKASTDTLSDEALLAQIISGGGTGQKRKYALDVDGDAAIDEDLEDDIAASARAKRSKTNSVENDGSSRLSGALSSLNTAANTQCSPDSQSPSDKDRGERNKVSGGGSTPPSLTRRISGTPSHGFELQIPSRPATPSASAASTPKSMSMGRSSLIPQEAMPSLTGPVRPPPPRAAFTGSGPTAPDSATFTTKPNNAATLVDQDDDDWTAFESDVVYAPPTTTVPAIAASYADGAVIAAAPMNAAQLAAKLEEEEQEKRRAQVDVDLEDEEEEAKRALENEFEEMEELEARVRKLKEKREAIRRGSVTAVSGPSAFSGGSSGPAGTGAEDATGHVHQEDDDDDDDDEEEDDDWSGFRFRA